MSTGAKSEREAVLLWRVEEAMRVAKRLHAALIPFVHAEEHRPQRGDHAGEHGREAMDEMDALKKQWESWR